ncbi:hypothetical protein [uncultured Thiocystis sp.]|jgi:hypothetical protein|uniref:hypothetical protein n=1 Tax=uncultured Thiocystis sp. TaxID=1202134 RepID=UPI0025F5A50D|nr:hypothetical protein [uncultured Thiocystis sp.]
MKKGKNKNNRSTHNTPPAARTPTQAATPNNLQSALTDALVDSQNKIPPTEQVTVPDAPAPPDASLERFWTIVKETRANYESAEKRALAREGEAQKSLLSLEAEKTKLHEATAKLREDRTQFSDQEIDYLRRLESLEPREQALHIQEEMLVKREAAIKAREINAETGFINERKASLAAMDQAVASLRDQLADTERSISTQRADWLCERQAESERLRAEIEEAVRQREQELAEQQNTLWEERRALDKRERLLQRSEDEHKEDRAGLDERVSQRLAREAEAFTHQRQALRDRLDQACLDRDTLEQKLRQREESDRRFGQRSPEQVLQELERLREENDRLQADLAARPDAQAAERLRALQEERANWQADRIVLLRQVSDAEGMLARHKIAATELEMLRDQKIAAEARVAVLQQARDELRTEVDQLIGRDEAKNPFQACSELDAAEYQPVAEMSSNIRNLKSFVNDLQQRIAYNPQDPEKNLYYSLADLRCFLGGLAMGRLILLQGISGTGKTSLPVAFARAIGSPFDEDNLVQVQAGWRDPQDLVGHYNAFEKRFYEQKFLRALYRAATPCWSDGIHLIVLDEMNLSYPEQYFSDMLSTLEQSIDKRSIELMPHRVDQAPLLFDNGKSLRIPKNVWFVGTANHDETTKDFAPKTYDRSLVMEFSDTPKPFDVKPPSPRKPLSYEALQRFFLKAQQDHGKDAQQVSEFLNNCVRDPLKNDFKIGWGPRLEDQLKRYCPVVVAAGGALGEAADHILAMRLLRQLRNRHDNQQKRLEHLMNQIQKDWSLLCNNSQPTKSIEILRVELARFGIESGENQ